MLGFINVYKRVGDTSAYVVNQIKKIYKCKCGHMGTLDPLASGVLPVALGQASRLFSYMVDKEKTYLATFDFSFTTPSLDLETEPTNYSDRVVSKEEIEKVLPNFIGNISQTPPAYSAKCVDGTKAYKLARRGKTVELSPKTVFIKSIKIVDKISENRYNYEIVCSGGTYIRALCRDMASALNVYGVMVGLERVKSGVFEKGNAFSLDEIIKSNDKSQFISGVEDVVDYPIVTLDDDSATRILNGLLEGYDYPNGVFKAYAFGSFWGIMKVEGGKVNVTYIRDL